MTFDQLCNIYLDYRNNFLSIDGFASYYELRIELAELLINKAREVYTLAYN